MRTVLPLFFIYFTANIPSLWVGYFFVLCDNFINKKYWRKNKYMGYGDSFNNYNNQFNRPTYPTYQPTAPQNMYQQNGAGSYSANNLYYPMQMNQQYGMQNRGAQQNTQNAQPEYVNKIYVTSVNDALGRFAPPNTVITYTLQDDHTAVDVYCDTNGKKYATVWDLTLKDGDNTRENTQTKDNWIVDRLDRLEQKIDSFLCKNNQQQSVSNDFQTKKKNKKQEEVVSNDSTKE